MFVVNFYKTDTTYLKMNIYLNRNTGNTIDIIADVIYTGLDYITVE